MQPYNRVASRAGQKAVEMPPPQTWLLCKSSIGTGDEVMMHKALVPLSTSLPELSWHVPVGNVTYTVLVAALTQTAQILFALSLVSVILCAKFDS